MAPHLYSTGKHRPASCSLVNLKSGRAIIKHYWCQWKDKATLLFSALLKNEPLLYTGAAHLANILVFPSDHQNTVESPFLHKGVPFLLLPRWQATECSATLNVRCSLVCGEADLLLSCHMAWRGQGAGTRPGQQTAYCTVVPRTSRGYFQFFCLAARVLFCQGKPGASFGFLL